MKVIKNILSPQIFKGKCEQNKNRDGINKYKNDYNS
jgi:hypothetical protein